MSTSSKWQENTAEINDANWLLVQRQLAATALGDIGSEEAVPVLFEALKDKAGEDI